jgi:CubicO group peptidase (beta-lactamase class C family)
MALESAPGGPRGSVIYSDVGYIILGMAIERMGGSGLASLFDSVVARPGGFTSTGFRPVASMAGAWIGSGSAAATAWCPLRERILQGEVHDDNAWVLGGAAGHAGLFSNIVETAGLVDCWIEAIAGASPLFDAGTARWFAFDDIDDPAGARTPGFDRPSAAGSNAGDLRPAGTIGHLGFTGTSFWFDRDSGDSIVLLTNRTNPDMNGRAVEIRAMRRQVYDAAWKALS